MKARRSQVARKLRFHLDECVPLAVAAGLERRGIDVVTPQDEDLLGADDPRHLNLAAEHDRVLITQDADFLRIHGQGPPHAGIAYYQPGSRSIGELISRLVLLHAVLTPEEMRNRVEFL